MKKEAIITIIIILLIVAGECITQNYTKKNLGKVEEDLKMLKTEIMADDAESSNLVEETEKIYEEWEDVNEHCLSYYLEHNELEKINVQIVLVKGFLEADSTQDAIAELEEALYIINHLKEKQILSLRNLF